MMSETITQLQDKLDDEINYFWDLLKFGLISESEYDKHIEEITHHYNELIDEIITNYYT